MAGKEARRHPRRPTQGLNIICYRTETMARYKPRQNIGKAILDISQGGCRVALAERVEPGMQLTIELKDAGTGDVFHAHGTVCWVSDAKPGEPFACSAGIQFVEIYTSLAKREKFFQGRGTRPTEAAAAAGSSTSVRPPAPADAGPTDLAPGQLQRSTRFHVDDYAVTVTRSGLLGSVGLRKNVATMVVDLSRTGAQVLCTEKMPPGTKVSFMIHLNKFADTFETEAEVVWTKEYTDERGPQYSTGLKFSAVSATRQRLLDYMMSWFTSYQHRYRQDQRGQGPPP